MVSRNSCNRAATDTVVPRRELSALRRCTRVSSSLRTVLDTRRVSAVVKYSSSAANGRQIMMSDDTLLDDTSMFATSTGSSRAQVCRISGAASNPLTRSSSGITSCHTSLTIVAVRSAMRRTASCSSAVSGRPSTVGALPPPNRRSTRKNANSSP